MSVVGLSRLALRALGEGLESLLPIRSAPCGDAGVRVSPQVIGPRRALLRAQFPVCSPRLVVDADYAAGGPLRRHEHSVADRAMTRHLPAGEPVTGWLSNDLLVTGHPVVRFKGAKAAPKRSNKPP